MKKRKKNNCILHFIISDAGGGAENIVNSLTEKKNINNFKIYGVYISSIKNKKNRSLNRIFLNSSPFNILVLFKLYFLIKKLNKHNNIYLHSHLSYCLYYSYFISFFFKIKLYHTEHNTFNNRRKYFFFKYIENIIFYKFTKIVCISNAVKLSLHHWLYNFNKKKLIIIYNGVRIFDFHNESAQLEKKNNELFFLSVGSLTNQKGYIPFLDIIKQVESIFDKYYIVGSGPLKKNIQKKIKKLNLTNKIKIINFTPNIENYYRKADLLIIPSKWEGFGLVAVEGLSVGLPIIANNVDGLNEILKKNKEYVKLQTFQDVDGWVKSIKEFVSLIKKRNFNKFYEAHNYSKTFNKEIMIDNYYKKIYK
tara:strand:+ start:533 stop:1624 length:1092 start_codon:yes stop_codon:yes gene_type:complete